MIWYNFIFNLGIKALSGNVYHIRWLPKAIGSMLGIAAVILSWCTIDYKMFCDIWGSFYNSTLSKPFKKFIVEKNECFEKLKCKKVSNTFSYILQLPFVH